MSVRLCIPKIEKMLTLHADGRAEGTMAEAGRLVLQRLRGLNITIISEPSMGIVVDHQRIQYDGCFGSIQKNHSDMTYGMVIVPMRGPNLTQTVVDGFEKMAILSTYKVADLEDASRTQVMDMFYALSPGVWSLLTAYYVCLFCMLAASVHTCCSGMRKQKWRLSRTAIMASMLKQYSACDFPQAANGIRMLFTSVVLLSFYAGYYLTSMIKTEMVVVNLPVTVQTYQDLIDQGKRPIWMRVLNDWNDMKDAPAGDIQRKVWELAVRKGIPGSLIAPDMESLASHMHAIAKGDSVWLLKFRVFEHGIQKAACSFGAQAMPSRIMLVTHDPDAPEFLSGNVENPLLPTHISQLVNKRIKWSFESSLMDAAGDRYDVKAIFPIDLEADKHASTIVECASNIITTPYPEMTAVVGHHFLSLAILCLCLILIAMIFLIFEQYSAYHH
jgi:hypothetical protein